MAAAHLVIDESTAMTLTRTTREHARAGFLSTGLVGLRAVEPRHARSAPSPATRWVIPAPTVSTRPSVARSSALLWPRLTTMRNRVAALLGAAVALSLVPVTPAGVPVLAASVVALGMA